MAEYRVSERARGDLAEIFDFIAGDNEHAALGVIVQFTQLFQKLVHQPMMGREREDLKEGLRYIPHGSYLIFYRIWAGEVRIVRVLHAARDLDEIFS